MTPRTPWRRWPATTTCASGATDKARVRTIAKQLLQTRHATELRQLYDSEAKRLLDRRAQGLW